VTTGTGPTAGELWTIDATQCDPDRLRDRAVLGALFDTIVSQLALHPVAPATWHTFPHPGGVTGALILGESHLTVHTFPEYGSACLDLFTCVPRTSAESVLGQAVRVALQAGDVTIQRHTRAIAAPVVALG
jgi:S-adenosylmethionine decarboxylase